MFWKSDIARWKMKGTHKSQIMRLGQGLNKNKLIG